LRRRNVIKAESPVEILIAESDIYVARIADRLTVKLGPLLDMPIELVPTVRITKVITEQGSCSFAITICLRTYSKKDDNLFEPATSGKNFTKFTKTNKLIIRSLSLKLYYCLELQISYYVEGVFKS
jgi:hypothetical protein